MERPTIVVVVDKRYAVHVCETKTGNTQYARPKKGDTQYAVRKGEMGVTLNDPNSILYHPDEDIDIYLDGELNIMFNEFELPSSS